MEQPACDDKIVERTRRYMKARWLLAAGLMAAILTGFAITQYIAFARIVPFKTWSAVFWSINAVLGACCLAMFYWGFKSTRGWSKALARTHTDELQQRRRRQALMQVPTWALLCWLAYHPDSHGYPNPSHFLPAIIGIAVPLSAAQIVGGWRMWGSQIAYMTLADDELTKAQRGKAMAVGYGVLMLGVGIGFPVALLWPSVVPAFLVTVLWLGFTIPTLTLAWLEYRAERNG